METQQKTHPSNRVLAAFALERLPADARPRVEAHLRGCPFCSDFVRETPKAELQALLRAGTVSQAEQSTPGERVRDTVATPVANRPLTPGPSPARGEGRQESPPTAQPVSSALAAAEIPPALREQTKYRILRLLGRGGMGSVYQAHHERMDRQVAIKVINPDLVDHPQAIERFNAEVRAVAKLDHRNIARAYDAEPFGSLQTIVMEYVAGQTVYNFLKGRLKAGKPLSVTEACRLVRQALVGLQHAHERGIAHRDLKPQNLMLTRDEGIVKILDFGLAKLTSDRSRGLTKTNVTMGTYEYLAPEQAMDAASADIRSDIYSLGCTLYYLLAGVLPFNYPADAKLLMAHQMETPKPLVEMRPEVPQAVSDLVARMLAKNPAVRPQTPAEAAEILLPFARGDYPPPAAASPSGSALPDDVMAMIGSQAVISAVRLPGSKSKPANQQLAQFLRRRWIPLTIVVLALAVAGIAAFAGLFKIRTPEGTIALSVNQPDTEVTVDGQKIVVLWGADHKTAEITATPGKHRIEVKKQGFAVSGNDLTIEDGGHEILSVELESAGKQEIVNSNVPANVINSGSAITPATRPDADRGTNEVCLTAWKRILNQPVQETVDSSLGDAMVKLGNECHVNFWLDVGPRSSPRVSFDTHVGVKSHPGETLRELLDELLEPKQLAWIVRDGVIFITSTERQPTILETRVYKVLQPISSPATLVSEITSLVSPTSWSVNGGLGTVAPWSTGAFVITQSQKIHETLERHYAGRLQSIDPCEELAGAKALGADSALSAKLDTAVDCELAQTPLKDAIATLSTQSGLEMRFDASSSGVTPISPAAPITGRLHGIRLASALDLILGNVGGTWSVDHDTLLIISDNDSKRRCTLVSYDLHGLIPSGTEPQSLAQLVQYSIDPWSWAANGGPGGIAVGAFGALEVNQTDVVHRRIEQLLAVLRVAQKNGPLSAAPSPSSVASNSAAAWQTPEFRKWAADVAATAPEAQLQAVKQKLQELNPGFNGQLKDSRNFGPPVIENGRVAALGVFSNRHLVDLSPIRALSDLQSLDICWEEHDLTDLSPLTGMHLTRFCIDDSGISDLSPLRGMQLSLFRCGRSPVSDLSPLKGMPISLLDCTDTQVADLSPLVGMPLNELRCDATPVSDISPLKGIRLAILGICNTPVSDLSPLEGMQLTQLVFTPAKIKKGIEAIRGMRSLQKIGPFYNALYTPAEFWRRYDSGGLPESAWAANQASRGTSSSNNSVADSSVPAPIARFRFRLNTTNEGSGEARMDLRNTEFKDGGLYLNGLYDIGGPRGAYHAVCWTPSYTPSAFTVVLRFRSDDFGGKKSNLLFGGVSWRWFSIKRSADGNLRIALKNTSFVHEVRNARLVEGKWQIVAVSLDMDAHKIIAFLNGIEVDDFSVPSNLAFSDREKHERNWTFSDYGNGDVFKGTINEFDIYDIALSARQIENLHLSAEPSKQTGATLDLSSTAAAGAGRQSESSAPPANAIPKVEKIVVNARAVYDAMIGQIKQRVLTGERDPAARAALNDRGLFPLVLKPIYQSQIDRARAAMRTSYEHALRDYRADRKSSHSDAIAHMQHLLDKFELEPAGLNARMAAMPPPDVSGEWKSESPDSLIAITGKTRCRIDFGKFEWRDYDFFATAEARDFDPKHGPQCMMYSHATTWEGGHHPTNCWEFAVGPWSVNDEDLRAFAKGTDTWNDRSRRWLPNRYTIEDRKPFKIELQVRGPKITVLLDGKMFTESSKNELTFGRAGIGDDYAGTARFSDIEVRMPDGDVLWRGSPLAHRVVQH
jgi:serine/threonine protein kinase